MLELSTPLSTLSGFGARFLSKLERLHIYTVKDLLWHFPTRYEDFSKIYTIVELIPNQEATIQGMVEKIKSRPTWRRNLFLVEAILSDTTGSIRAIWFNQPYIRNVLQPGRIANFSGKTTISKKTGELYLSNPTYELVHYHGEEDEFEETKHTARIVPIYPETKGFTSKGLRYLIKPILDTLPPLSEPLPQDILKKEGFLQINLALKEIHFPNELEYAIAAKKRFAFEDLFFLQLRNLLERMRLQKESAPAIHIPKERISKFLATLPFELTPSQSQSLSEIVHDIGEPHPMNRLLQGDVGSGKTIVAALAAIETGEVGYQSAFMAPTEILARQHYQTLKKFFSHFEGGIALLTSSESKVYYGHDLEATLKKPILLSEIQKGNVKVIVGTHALIQKTVQFKNLGFIIVDEQHRFGVRQRDELLKRAKKCEAHGLPHFLSMSATPIPRTLNLTLFGDLDLSLITELPKNRKEIITKAVTPENRTKAYAFIRGHLKRGRQAFVICPRIEPKESTEFSELSLQKLELKSVKEEFEKLSKKIFPDFRVGIVHGKLKPREKESVMKKFSDGSIDILVATSVIEVGIDVPNATIMMIEGTDRFGLAQLYQFRGRVGRGEHQSFCFLFSDSSSTSVKERIQSIVEAKNGFELAERDLKLRGPGEFLGEIQTGMPDLAMKAIQNPELVKHAREAALSILKKDASLSKHPLLQERLSEFQKTVHWE